MTRTRAAARLPAALLALALAALAPGCRGGGNGAGGEAGGADASASTRRYTVRGELVRIEDARGGVREISVRHEAIDDFADASGKVVGMASMVMPFEVPGTIPLDDVGVGDKIELRFAMTWSPPSMRVEALRKLPAETALRFGEARPPPAP